MQTDYKNLNDRIVKQAYEVSNLVLTNDMKVRLFQNKIDRVEQMIRARAAVYYQTDKYTPQQEVAGNEVLCYTIN